jgi:hypothetical protein
MDMTCQRKSDVDLQLAAGWHVTVEAEVGGTDVMKRARLILHVEAEPLSTATPQKGRREVVIVYANSCRTVWSGGAKRSRSDRRLRTTVRSRIHCPAA